MTFELAQGSVTRNVFAAILDRVERLAMPPLVVVSRRMSALECRGGRKWLVSGGKPARYERCTPAN